MQNMDNTTYSVHTNVAINSGSDNMKERMQRIKQKQQLRKQALREKKLLQKQKKFAKKATMKQAKLDRKMAKKEPIAKAAFKAARNAGKVVKKQLARELDAQVVLSDNQGKINKNIISTVVNQRVDVPITLRNNGTITWPEKVKLVLVATKTKNECGQAGLNLPQEMVLNSLLPLQEGLLTIQCTPTVAGRYLSVFRLVTESGKKFGQCIRLLFNATLPVIQLEQPVSVHPKIVLNVAQKEAEPQPVQPQATVVEVSPPTMQVVAPQPSPSAILVQASTVPLVPTIVLADAKQGDVEVQDEKKKRFVGKKENNNKKQFPQEWNQHLDTLFELGYKAKGLNMKLLKQNNGSVEEVIRVINEMREKRQQKVEAKKAKHENCKHKKH